MKEYTICALALFFAATFGHHVMHLTKIGLGDFAEQLRQQRNFSHTEAHRQAVFSFFFSIAVSLIATAVFILTLSAIIFNKPINQLLQW